MSWIEKLIKNDHKEPLFVFFKFVSCGIVIFLPFFLVFKSFHILNYKHAIPMMILVGVAYLLTMLVVGKLSLYPRVSSFGLCFSILLFSYMAIILVISAVRVYYSRSYLLISFLLSLLSLLTLKYLEHKHKRLRFVLLSDLGGNEAEDLARLNIEFLRAIKPSEDHYDGIVVKDIKSLSPDIARFIVAESLKGTPVYTFAELYAAFLGRAPLNYIDPDLLGRNASSSIYKGVKRAVELSIATVFLVPATVIGLIIAISIMLDSEGPVFFIQERVGQNGKPFKLIKFRTMHNNSESNGPQFAEENDSRVTRVGKFLRKTRLDELPQLINVIRGDMSFVGPRPEQIPFARQFEEKIPYYNLRYSLKPGLTGWAQINRGYTSGLDDTREKLEYDLFYLRYESPWLDLLILFKTLNIVLTGFGAR